eukprot:13985890-Alexandrium_andersonii.AAC.1
MAPYLHPAQGGAKSGPDSEAMVLTMACEAPAAAFPYAVSLDFQKCFDNTSLEMGLGVMQEWG